VRDRLPRSAKSMMSPGRSARKSAATAVPDRTCSRAVLGNVIPCFANTYFVKPEQSKPSLGVLPPHTYLTPTYESAVRSTRAAAADAAGDVGIRLREGVDLPVRVVVDDGMFAMTVAMTVWGDTPRVPGAQPVRDRRDATATAPTRASEGVIMPNAKADLTPGVG
jgi:hypothetical protein